MGRESTVERVRTFPLLYLMFAIKVQVREGWPKSRSYLISEEGTP